MSPQAKAVDEDRSKCTPCRGTGKVVSNLGGEQREVTCPWCGGSGSFVTGRDAQDPAAANAPTEAEDSAPAAETPQ